MYAICDKQDSLESQVVIASLNLLNAITLCALRSLSSPRLNWQQWRSQGILICFSHTTHQQIMPKKASSTTC